jgi:hypothetical protein
VIRIIAISPANTYPTPAGYSDNDYQKLVEIAMYNNITDWFDITDSKTQIGTIEWSGIPTSRTSLIKFNREPLKGKLDVSDFTELWDLDVRGNSFTEINVSNCVSLEVVDVEKNHLTDISTLENLENLKYVDVSDNFLNLNDPTIQASIAKIQATIDKNGGEFIYTPQRTPTCEYCDPSMTSCECLFFECCGLVYFDGVYWYEICTCGGNPVTTEPPVSTTTLPHTTTTTGATTTTGTGTTVSVATTTPTVSSETTPPTTTAPATTTTPVTTPSPDEFYPGKPGHILGNPTITISDALEVLRHLAKLPSVIETSPDSRQAACIVSEDSPTINDVLEILKKLAKLPNKIDGTA